MKSDMSLFRSSAFAIGCVATALAGILQAQQVPIPQTAAEVPGPTSGPMTKAYVQMVGAHGLRVGVASRLCVQPADGAHEGSRNGSPRRRDACRPDESGRDADQLHQSCRDLRRHPEPGCRVRVGLAVARKGTGGLASARLRKPVLDVPGVRRAHGRDQRARVAIRHQARFLHGRGAELERHNAGRHCRRRALDHRLRRGDAAHLHE